MDFEELQQSWKSQPIDIPADNDELKGQVVNKWQAQQKKLMWANIATTIAFIVVFVDFAWVYYTFHAGHTIFFSGSILFMTALLLAYLVILWKGVAYKKNDPSLPITTYLDHYLQKLYWRRKTITIFSWIYAVLLWLALMFYIVDVTHKGSLLFQGGAILATTAYIFGMQLIFSKTKRKKHLQKLDELIAEIKQLKDSIDQ